MQTYIVITKNIWVTTPIECIINPWCMPLDMHISFILHIWPNTHAIINILPQKSYNNL